MYNHSYIPQAQKYSTPQLSQSRKLQKLQKQLYSLKHDDNVLLKQYNSLKKERNVLKKDYDALFKQNNQLKNLSAYSLKLENQGLKKQILDHQQDVKNLESYRKQLQHQIRQYQNKQEKNSPKRNQVNVQLGNRGKKIQNNLQNQQLVKNNFKHQALKSDYFSLQQKFKQAQKEQKKIAQQFQAQKQQLSKKINCLQNQQIPALRGVIQEQNNKIALQKNQLAIIKPEYQRLVQHAQRLNKKLIDVSEHVKDYKTKSDSLQIVNKKHLSQLKTLLQQKQQLLKCIDGLNKQIQSKDKQYCQLLQSSIAIKNIKNQTGIHLPKLEQKSNSLPKSKSIHHKKLIQLSKQTQLNVQNNYLQAQQEKIAKQSLILITKNQLNQMTEYKKKYLQINSNQNKKSQDNFKSILFQDQKQQKFNQNNNLQRKYTVTQEQYNEAVQQIKKLKKQIEDTKRINQDIFKRNLSAQSTVDKLVEQNQQFKHRNSILILNDQKTKKQQAKTKQQIFSLQKQIQNLNKHIFEQKSENSKLMIMHTNQKQKSQQLEGKLKKQTDYNQKINGNLQNKVKQLGDVKAKIQKYKKQRQSEQQNMSIKYNQLIQKLQYYKSQAQNYKKACFENNVIIGQITQNQENQKREAISIKQQQIKELSAELKELKHQFSLQQEKNKELRRLAEERLTQLKKKDKQLQQSTTGNNILKNQISALQQSNLQLQKEIESNQNMLKQLNENIRNHASIKEEYETRLDQLARIVTNNKTLQKQFQNLLIKQKKVQAEKQEQSRLKNQEIQLQNTQIEKGKQEAKRLKSELSAKENKIKHIQQQLLLKTQQKNGMVSPSSVQVQMKQFKQKLERQFQEQLQKQRKFNEDQLKVLKEQIKQLKKQKDSSSIQKSKQKKFIESLQQEKQSINNQMKSITVDYEKQKNKVSKVESSRNQLIKQNEEMRKQIVKLNQEAKNVDSQSSQLNSLLDKIKLKESQHQLLKIQLQSCKDRHQSQIKKLRESLKKLEGNDLASTDYIQELKKQKEQIKNRANTLQKQLQQRHQQNQMLKDENQFVKEENQNLKNQISKSNKKSQLQRTKNLRKQQPGDNIQQQITHLNSQITKLTNETSQQQQLIKKISLQNKELTTELSNKQRQNKNTIQKLQQLIKQKGQLYQLKKQLQKLKQKNKQLSQQLSHQQSQNKQLSQQLSQKQQQYLTQTLHINNNFKQNQKQIKTLKDQQQLLFKQLKQCKQILDKIQYQYDQQDNHDEEQEQGQNQNQEQQTQDNERNFIDNEDNNKSKIVSIAQLTKSITERIKQIASSRNQLKKQFQKIKSANSNTQISNLAKTSPPINQNLSQPSNINSASSVANIPAKYLISGDIIHSVRNQLAEELVSRIQKGMRKKIQRTSLLFKMNQNPDQSKDPHPYIDQKPCWLLLVKLQNGQVIGGFSEKQLCRGLDKIKKWQHFATLFSVTNNRYFYLKNQSCRAITYDGYYLIFGNSEIEIRNGQRKVNSNFNTNGGFYNSQGCQHEILLDCKTDRQAQIETFEVHQVVFKQYLASNDLENRFVQSKPQNEEIKIKIDCKSLEKQQSVQNRAQSTQSSQFVESLKKRNLDLLSKIESLQCENVLLKGQISKQNIVDSTEGQRKKLLESKSFKDILLKQINDVQKYFKFNGDILKQQNKKEKKFVFDQIQKLINKKILATTIIFKKTLNSANLVSTIKNSLKTAERASLLLFKSKANKIFAILCYYDDSKFKRSVLINLSTQQIFCSKIDTKIQGFSEVSSGSIYQFGAGQVKIKNSTPDEIQINLSIMGQRYFQISKSLQFTCQNSQKVQLEEVQVYSIDLVPFETQLAQLTNPTQNQQSLVTASKSAIQRSGRLTEQIPQNKQQKRYESNPKETKFRSFNKKF